VLQYGTNLEGGSVCQVWTEKNVIFTPTEFKIVYALLKNKDRVCPTDALSDLIGQENPQNVNVQLSHIRKKLRVAWLPLTLSTLWWKWPYVGTAQTEISFTFLGKEIFINFDARTIYVGGILLKLPRKTFMIYMYYLNQHGKVLSNEWVCSYFGVTDETLKVHICNINKKLKDFPGLHVINAPWNGYFVSGSSNIPQFFHDKLLKQNIQADLKDRGFRYTTDQLWRLIEESPITHITLFSNLHIIPEIQAVEGMTFSDEEWYMLLTLCIHYDRYIPLDTMLQTYYTHYTLPEYVSCLVQLFSKLATLWISIYQDNGCIRLDFIPSV
jgi:DNA-binding response OmpR family regulator